MPRLDLPGVPDTLFSLQFTAIGGAWGLNVIGDNTFSLYWDAATCDPSKLTCFSDPRLVPFVIVPFDAPVDSGTTARVNVSLTEAPTVPVTPVPEPSSLVLVATGLVGVARSMRRRVGAGRIHNARG
jgi:hypothetical protein